MLSSLKGEKQNKKLDKIRDLELQARDISNVTRSSKTQNRVEMSQHNKRQR